ncbi:unnamed protein product [Polarella glacialis]|uniref:HRDC domain-containing protein n=1 Tax=Polarella glacialis TaxID=89957 RepID=A0A813M3J9_POLGL|nr:unnamed protein product [Polarella glacialis]
MSHPNEKDLDLDLREAAWEAAPPKGPAVSLFVGGIQSCTVVIQTLPGNLKPVSRKNRSLAAAYRHEPLILNIAMQPQFVQQSFRKELISVEISWLPCRGIPSPFRSGRSPDWIFGVSAVEFKFCPSVSSGPKPKPGKDSPFRRVCELEVLTQGFELLEGIDLDSLGNLSQGQAFPHRKLLTILVRLSDAIRWKGQSADSVQTGTPQSCNQEHLHPSPGYQGGHKDASFRYPGEHMDVEVGSEEQLTLAKLGDKLQKACKWRGEEATPWGLHASDDAMFVIVSLLGAGYLREEFRHSPYSTNAYLVGTPSADRVLAGQEEVPAAARELGTPSPLLHSPVVLGPVESAARAAATLRAGGSSPGADRAQHAAVARRLQKLRVSLGQRFGVPGQYILSDEEVAALAAMPAIPASPGALKPLCAVKRRLYGQAVLVSLRDEALPQVAADAIDLDG